MKHFRTILLVLLVLAFALEVQSLLATPTVGTPYTTSPTILSPNTATPVTITSQITDPTLIPGSVNLIRVNGDGTIVGPIAVMSSAGNNLYSTQITLNEPVQGLLEFRVSAAFKGMLKRVVSSPLQFAVENPAGAGLTDIVGTTAPVVLCTVASQQSISDRNGNVETEVVLEVSQVLRGQTSSSTITAVVPGGIIGGLQSLEPGAPSFTTGESVVLILGGPNSQGQYSIPNGALGVYHVRASPTLGQIAVVDVGYTQVDSAQSQNPVFAAFLQNSSAGEITVAQLYSELGV